jgi:IS4 transposase
MLLSGPFEKFVEASPVTVMMRGIIENLFHPERLDRLFDENAVTQYTRTLPFSTVAEVMGEVVFNVNPSVGASLQERVDSLPVSTRAFYLKLNGVEPKVAAVLVRDSVRQLAPVIRKLGLRTPLLPGYNIRILDGNHFAATEHRILETRGETAAPLPGQALTVLDPDLRLAIDVFPCEDGHSQERSLLDQVLLTVCLGDLWIADRNFCTLGFLFGIARLKGRFLIRHHASMPLDKTGVNKLIGESETGRVFEQSGKITDPQTGRSMTVRCVTVKLKTATRDGEREIVILTNLPKKDADAMKVAALYRKRWTVETMFQEMTENLTCEIKTLGYPRAAVFAFCLALMAWNGMSVIHAALRSVHGEETVEKNLSSYYLSLEISQVYHGMLIAIPPAEWEIFRNLTTVQLASLLKQLAVRVSLKQLQKHPRGPKRQQPKRKYSGNGKHVATAKLLARRSH